ncbi:MAG: hypothetical protein QF464_17045 [Myxococcota bacterium]|jgi:hypothetical protein|nr:hypothetical protein [Myxococcota bacterium]
MKRFITVIAFSTAALTAVGCFDGRPLYELCAEDCQQRLECGAIINTGVESCVDECFTTETIAEETLALACYDAKVDLTTCTTELSCLEYQSYEHGGTSSSAGAIPCQAEKAYKLGVCADTKL